MSSISTSSPDLEDSNDDSIIVPIGLPDIDETQIFQRENEIVSNQLSKLIYRGSGERPRIGRLLHCFCNLLLFYFDKQKYIYFFSKREVALFLKTDGHKALGPESTPFELPPRWTYETLRVCIADYVARTNKIDVQTVIIDQLYYKKSKGKGLVLVNGDGDIGALLKEYPLTYRSGKKKSQCTMYMAVDYHVECEYKDVQRAFADLN